MKIGDIIKTDLGPAKLVALKDGEALLRLEPRVLVDQETGKSETHSHAKPWIVQKLEQLLTRRRREALS